MENRKRIIRNTIFLYIKTLISTLVVFFSTRIVLGALGASDYGVYGIVGGVIAMLGYINIAMSHATQRYMNFAEGTKDKNRMLSIFNNAVILHLMMGVAIVAILELIYYWMFNGVLNIPVERVYAAKLIYHFMAVSTFFTVITVPYEALINAHEDFLYYSIVGIVDSLLKLSAAYVIVWYAYDKLILYGILMAVITVIMLIVMRIYCHRKYTECVLNFRRFGKLETMKELGAFAGWNFVGVFASVAGNFGSTILMNHFFGTIVIAAKNIGDQLGGQLSVVTTNLTKALNPSIMKSEGAGNHKQMVELCYTACRFGFLLYALFAIPFIFKTEYLLGLWLKEIPKWAVLFCQLQVLRTLSEQIFSPLRTMLMAQGTIKQLNMANLALGIFTFVVLLLLYCIGLPSYWHYIISILFMVVIESVVKIYLCKKHCSIRYVDVLSAILIRISNVIIVSCIVCYVLDVFLCNNLNGLLCTFVLVMGAGVVTFLLGLKKNERKYIINILIRKK